MKLSLTVLLLCLILGCGRPPSASVPYSESAGDILDQAKPIQLAMACLKEGEFDKLKSMLSAASLAELERELKVDQDYLRKFRARALSKPEDGYQYCSVESWVKKVGETEAAQYVQMAKTLPPDQSIVIRYQKTENGEGHGPTIVCRENGRWKLVVHFRPLNN